MSTLSTRLDTVSGGDVLVQIEVPRRVRPRGVRVRLDGRNITNAFRRSGTRRTLIAWSTDWTSAPTCSKSPASAGAADACAPTSS